jgi:hypothetical protein
MYRQDNTIDISQFEMKHPDHKLLIDHDLPDVSKDDQKVFMKFTLKGISSCLYNF